MFGRKKQQPLEFLKLDPYVTFIENAGGSVVTNNILTGAGKVRWASRENSTNPVDNGWRFISDIDDQKYLDDAGNSTIADFNTVANIEPAVLELYELPVGTDVTLERDGATLRWVHSDTGVELGRD